MSTQRYPKRDYSFAQRIRYLRGRLTQQEFSDKIGVSRSSLANYETGRSNPNIAVLRQIAGALDLPETFFSNVDEMEEPDAAAVWGTAIEGRPNWTEDEVAIVRLLRIAEPETIKGVLTMLLEAIPRGSVQDQIVDLFNLEADVARLKNIAKNDGRYSKGETSIDGDDLTKFLAKNSLPKSGDH